MGSRRTNDGVKRVYEAAKAWVDCALRADGSLFTPGEAIWSSRWLGELRERFLDRPDESNDSFRVKLERQLRGSPPEVYQLMAEALYVYFLIVSTKSAAAEARVINTVLAMSRERVLMPEKLVTALTPGICTPGPFFHSGRPFQVGFIVELAQQWKEREASERDRLLADPWAFREFIMGVELRSDMLKGHANAVRAQQLALLHLVCPDTFEGIVSFDHKRLISQAFKGFVTEPTDDVDRMLAQIRHRLEEEHGRGIHLYEDAIRSQWDPQAPTDVNPKLWDDFVSRAKAFYASGRLDSWEVDYKLEIGGKLSEAREAVLAGAGNWADLIKGALKPDVVNFVRWTLIDNLNQWCAEHPGDALTGLQFLWASDASSIEDRIRDFCEFMPASVSNGVGTRTTIVSALLMGLDVEKYPPFQVRVFEDAYKQTGYKVPEKYSDEATLYEHALGFLQRFRDEAQKRGLSMRHHLDAQSYVWGILKHRVDDDNGDEDPEPDPYSIDPWAPDRVAALAEKLLWEPPGMLQEIVDDLQEKGQVIFYGPPGTGKTYVARAIAKQCELNGGEFEIVQFHPSYAYEDFVEGYRPRLTESGQAGFELVHGPLRRIAEKARAVPKANFILLIDELNRGNVAKVLGELYFLLEYRDEAVRLQYGGGERFTLPGNLWFICTMNTADRSIALMDAALRRRFYFAPFFPDEPPVKGLLERWLAREGQPTWVAELVDAANSKLDRDMGIGPSYFIGTDRTLDEGRVRRIWRRAVIPYIEEQCFGNEDKLKQFDYDRLKRELDSGVAGPDGVGEEDSTGDASA